MNSTDRDSDHPEDEVDSTQASAEATDTASEGEGEEEKIPLNLDVKVTEPSTCQRHVTVTVPREDIDRYIGKAVNDLLPKAEVPGFRPGRAPRKLIEARFRDHVKDQVKSSLLMDSMAQIGDAKQFTAISEPSFNVDAIALPETGPMTFEFDIEVRPEFEMPDWKGLKLSRPIHPYSDEEVQRHFDKVLERYSEKTPVTEEPSAPGDFVTVNATIRVGDAVVSQHRGIELRARERLSFRDAHIESGRALLVGVRPGDRREAPLTVAKGIESPYAGQSGTVEIEVTEVQRLEPPAMTPAFLTQIGGFESEAEVHDFLRGELQRQFSLHQQRQIRQQIAATLTRDANWELPPELLRRQSGRELERAVMEMRSNGIGDDEIRAYANQLRHNSQEATRTALKEHFIFERIAEMESIDAEPEDYDEEIRRIANQSDESERRVRARYEKRGQMDALRNQIVERKVIDLICQQAQMADVATELPTVDEFALDVSITEKNEESAIPEAKHGESGSSTLMPTEERK